MSYAFGHLVGAWCIGKFYEYVSKKRISHAAWFFLLLGSILPDTDFLIDWTLGHDTHRTFTHSFLFLWLVPIMIYLLFSFAKHSEKDYFAFFIGIGIATHLFLDSFFGFGVPLLWPSKIHYSFISGITLAVPQGTAFSGTAAEIGHQLKFTIFDMAIGTTWIFYLWFRKRIKF